MYEYRNLNSLSKDMLILIWSITVCLIINRILKLTVKDDHPVTKPWALVPA